MKTALARWFFLPMLFLVLTGCTLPALNLAADKEAALFSQGLDLYIASGDLTTLQQLPQKYPKGTWRPRAESIIDMVKQQLHLQDQLKKQAQKLSLCQDEKVLASCQKEKIALVQDNQMLEETLKRLKEVLIDTEKRTE